MLFSVSVPSECVPQLPLLYFWEEKRGTAFFEKYFSAQQGD
jgi:hypothetical protein